VLSLNKENKAFAKGFQK